MKTVKVSKRKLVFTALAVVALLGAILAVIDIEPSSTDGKSNSASDVVTNDPVLATWLIRRNS